MDDPLHKHILIYTQINLYQHNSLVLGGNLSLTFFQIIVFVFWPFCSDSNVSS